MPTAAYICWIIIIIFLLNQFFKGLFQSEIQWNPQDNTQIVQGATASKDVTIKLNETKVIKCNVQPIELDGSLIEVMIFFYLAFHVLLLLKTLR